MSRQKPFAVIDAETDPFLFDRVPKPFIWGYYDGDQYLEFNNTEKLIRFLCFQKIVVYAHNGGKFDFHFLLDYLMAYDDVMVINGRISCFEIGLCEFRDSINILPVSLATWNKQDIDYKIMEKENRNKPENKKIISDYLKSDCVNTYEFISAFETKYGRHLTQAGAAMKIWQKQTDIQIANKNKNYYDLFEPYYYGGRVQCFQHGKIDKPFAVADINSAYPSAMLEQHPISMEYDYQPGPPVTIKGHAFFDVEGIAKGCFPFRGKDSLFFPDDNIKRHYTITGWELLTALKTDTIKDYKILGHYEHNEIIDFSDYILPLYQERLEAKQNGDKANDIFSKLLMNSLYGKFGSNPDNYKKFEIHPSSDMGELTEPFEFAGFIGPWILAQRKLEPDECCYYNVATSASITGYVRAQLWENVQRCDGLLYCDTDSLAAHNIDGLDLGDKLGQWGIEGKFERAYIGGRKLYAFEDNTGDWKTASKGVNLDPEQIIKIVNGEETTHYPMTPTFSVKQKPRFTPRRIKYTADKRLENA